MTDSSKLLLEEKISTYNNLQLYDLSKGDGVAILCQSGKHGKLLKVH